MAVSFTNIESTYFSYLTAAVKDSFFNLSFTKWKNILYVLLPVRECVQEWGEGNQAWRRATAETGETAVSFQSPPPLPRSPWMSPSHPFSDPPLPQSSVARGYAALYTHTHTGSHITIWSAWVAHYWCKALFSQRTSTGRIHVLRNIHLLTKNRKDIVSSSNVTPPSSFPQTLTTLLPLSVSDWKTTGNQINTQVIFTCKAELNAGLPIRF